MSVSLPPAAAPTEIRRPFLRWAGSKRKLVPVLKQFWSDKYSRYVEPFAGSSCLFFAIDPSKALLADKNADLMEAYEVLRETPDQVFRCVTALPRNRSTYNHERSRNPGRLGRFERAVRFIYLNRNCFNGIYRTNNDGQFNVPFSASRTGAYLSLQELSDCARVLQKATLRCWDFGTTLRQAVTGDFVYIDPPYAVSERRVFREYGTKMFGTDDIDRLRHHLRRLDERHVDFVVSYADSPEGKSIAAEWTTRRIRVFRQVAGFHGSRRSAYELLITNIDREVSP